METHLKINHLAPYLPYGLTGICTEEFEGVETVYGISYYKGYSDIYLITSFDDLDIEYFKPILRPLSDLTKDELKNAEFDYQIDWLTHERDSNVKFYGSLEKFINKTDFGHVQYLISKHFDVFGLIEQGLAIDINTLNREL